MGRAKTSESGSELSTRIQIREQEVLTRIPRFEVKSSEDQDLTHERSERELSSNICFFLLRASQTPSLKPGRRRERRHRDRRGQSPQDQQGMVSDRGLFLKFMRPAYVIMCLSPHIPQAN